MGKIKYSDFIKIFQISPKQLNDWGPGLEVRPDGLYVKNPKEYVDCFITPGELSILTSHPTGDLSKPALNFPCRKEELTEFINFYGFNDYYDPEILAGIPDDQSENAKLEQKATVEHPQTAFHKADTEDFIKKLQISRCSGNSILIKARNRQDCEFSCSQIGFTPRSKGWELLMEVLQDKDHFFYVGIYNRYNSDTAATRYYNNRQQQLKHLGQKFIKFLNQEFKVNIPDDFNLFENQKGIERDGTYKPKFQIVGSFKNVSDIKEMSKEEIFKKLETISEQRKREKRKDQKEQLLMKIADLVTHASKKGWITRAQAESYIITTDEEIEFSNYDTLDYADSLESSDNLV